MRMLRAIAITALLVLLLPLTAHATDKGESLKYGGGGMGTVIFDGRMHTGKGYVCNDCHLDLFVTKKQARVSMAAHFTDQLCFSCHDNAKASKDCITCHRFVPGSGMTYSPYMREAMGRPVADEAERDALLTGRAGASQQTRACLSCHGDATLEPVTERGKERTLFVQQPAYGAGAHGGLPCVACHYGLSGEKSFTQKPHDLARPTAVDCSSCHTKRLASAVAGFSESVHVKKTNGRFTCTSCHNAHTMPLQKNQPGYADTILEYNKTCLNCHTNPARLAALSTASPDIKGMEHSFITRFQAHSLNVLCVDCHSPLGASGMGMDPHRILEKAEALRDCSSCHRDMDSLIVGRIVARDGNDAMLEGSYIPALKKPGTLDRAGGWALMIAVAGVLIHAVARMVCRKEARAESLKSEYVYPVAIRLFHWVNAACFALLVWTGLGIRFEAVGPALELASRLHQVAGYVLAANFTAFVVYGIATGDLRQYLPKGPNVCGKIVTQVRYYLSGFLTGADKPFAVTREQRFNPLQQLVYLLAFVLGMPVMILSGVLLLLPESSTAPLATRECLAAVHYALAIGYGVFLVAHLYLTTTGDSVFSLIKGMITGNYEHKE